MMQLMPLYIFQLLRTQIFRIIFHLCFPISTLYNQILERRSNLLHMNHSAGKLDKSKICEGF